MKLPVLTLSSLLLANASAFVTRPGSANLATRSAAAFSPRANTVRYMSADSMDFAKSEIASADVVVFSKSFCPFCTKTKSLMEELKIEAKVIELDEVDNGAAIQDALKEISGQRTVPNVFIKGNHLGGNDDTQAAAASGKLQEMLGM
jgi:glutaredoxin 3